MGGIPILSEVMDVMLSHPMLAFALLIVFLSLDSAAGFAFGFNGVLGTILTQAFNFIGVHIPILSGEILCALAFGYIGWWCMRRIVVQA